MSKNERFDHPKNGRHSPPVRWKRSTRRRRAAGSGYGLIRRAGPDPAELVAEMRACGAQFYIRADVERRDFRYSFRLKEDADRQRFAALLAQAKADPELLALVRVATFAAIMRKAWSLPARSA